MKKTGIGFFLLMSAVFAGAQNGPQSVTRTAGEQSGAQTAAQAAGALIREMTGTVEVKAPGATEWKAAVMGQTLEQASLISTGFKSTALITIGNSTITVRALTRLSIEEIAASQNEEKVKLNLRAGRIRADVRPPVGGKTEFSVKSPTATASVRGTVFEFDGTRLKVEEGRVHLGGETVTGAYVGKGHSTAADPERGSVAGTLEVVKEDLSPAFPAGAEGPALITVGGTRGNLDIRFEWPERE